MWRLLYSKHKLSASDRRALQRALEDVTYTCGAQLQDLELGDRFSDVFVRQIRCHDPVELYQSVFTVLRKKIYKNNLTAYIHSVKIVLLQGKSPSKEEFDLC